MRFRTLFIRIPYDTTVTVEVHPLEWGSHTRVLEVGTTAKGNSGVPYLGKPLISTRLLCRRSIRRLPQ